MIHVVGKDIAKFHCIYWPAFLRAAGFSFPQLVMSHGHWLKDKMKMSKSVGNVVDPFSLLKVYDLNSVRSYFLSQGPLIKDSNFEVEGLVDHHNRIIVDQYLNLQQRITGKKFMKRKSVFPPLDTE